MEERKILGAMLNDRGAYETLVPILLPGEDLSDIGQILYRKFQDYYERDETANSIDKDIIHEQLDREFPKKADMLKGVVASLGDVSAPNVLHEWVEMKKYNIGLKLSVALSQGNTKEAQQLIEQYTNIGIEDLLSDDTLYQGESVTNIINRGFGDNVRPIFPRALSDILEDGVVAGTHVIVFARPDSGKTAFVINNAVQWCKKGYKVLYIGNEDPPDQMLMRIVTRFTGKTKAEVQEDPDSADQLARERGYENLIFYAASPGTFKEVRSLVEEHQPDFVVIDQLRNMNVGESNKVLALEKAAQEARAIGQTESRPVVLSVTQAGDSADNKLVLTMGDVDFSNTGIPGQADLMIGIGTNEQQKEVGTVVLSICKNKVNGVYTHVPVKINPQYSQVISGA